MTSSRSLDCRHYVHGSTTLPLNTFFQTVPCWSSVSGSGRTHQLRPGTHAVRHNQHVVAVKMLLFSH